MGGFSALLGHAAAGFEGARQQDLQRQFADEQNRRSMAAELLGKVALDPNQPDEVRTPFTEAYMNLAQLPHDKKFDFKKHMAPAFDALAQYRLKQQQAKEAAANPPAPAITPGVQLPAGGPPPPPSGMSLQTSGTHDQVMPPGVAGPPQQIANAPQIQSASVPRPLAFPEPAVQAPAAPPAPPMSFFTGAHGVAENAGYAAQKSAEGTMTGTMEARRAEYSKLPGFAALPPETQAILVGGGSLLPMMRTVGAGAGYAKDLRAQGLEVPDNIKDDQWVNVKELGGGQQTFVPAAAPGEKAMGGGQLGTPGELEAQKQAIDLPFIQKKFGMRLANTLASQDHAFGLAMQASNYKDANQIFFKAQDDYIKRIGLERQMQTSYQDYLKTGSQQAQVQMLMAHVGMTTPVGGRVTRAAVEEAQESANRIGLNVAKWFHQDADGDYTFDGPKGGVNLTKQQMEQMLQLAKERVAVQHQQVGIYQDQLGGGGEFTSPSMSAVGAGAAKPRGGGPPKPPKSSVSAAPKVGTVEDGYRFKGGNPADKASWERVQ
jgi:hypothetical protein